MPWPLDDSKLDEYCKKLTGEHDYSVFVHKHARRERSNVLTVNRFVCKRLSETKEDAPVVTVRFEVEAKVRARLSWRYCHTPFSLIVDQMQLRVLGDLWCGI